MHRIVDGLGTHRAVCSQGPRAPEWEFARGSPPEAAGLDGLDGLNRVQNGSVELLRSGCRSRTGFPRHWPQPQGCQTQQSTQSTQQFRDVSGFSSWFTFAFACRCALPGSLVAWAQEINHLLSAMRLKSCKDIA